jgi:hypothetical protein
MSGVLRLMDVVIGHKCEVDECVFPCVDEETRCYDHSHNRMIEELFDFESVNCRFGGVTCQGQATNCNEHEVPMCDACHNIYQRIQVGRGDRSVEHIIAVRQYVDTLTRENEEMRK